MGIYYIIRKISGDYAFMVADNGDEIMIARALIPSDADEGDRLRYENLSYELL